MNPKIERTKTSKFGKNRIITIRLDEELANHLDAIATAQNTTHSQVIRTMIKKQKLSNQPSIQVEKQLIYHELATIGNSNLSMNLIKEKLAKLIEVMPTGMVRSQADSILEDAKKLNAEITAIKSQIKSLSLNVLHLF